MAGFFGFFDYTKPGKGVSKEDVDKKGLSLYFDIFFRRFWKIVTLNLIYILFSVPAIIIAWFMSTYAVSWLAAIAGIDLTQEMVNGLSLLSAFVTVIFLLLTGSGPASAGMTYVLRKYVNDTHSWVWSDFIDNFKSNFRQGMAVYVINVLVSVLCTVSVVFYSYAMQGVMAVALRTIMLLFAAMFVMCQMYTYQLMVSFELKLKDIYKNSFILLMARLPWNILAAAVTVLLIYAVSSISMSVPIAGIAVIGTLFYTVITFTQIFMTNNIIKKYVLEPATTAQTVEAESEPDIEQETQNIGG